MGCVKFSGVTDVGCVRTNNEDAFVARYIWDEKHILVAAIDGVGGYEGGEIASALACESIVEYLEKYYNGERMELLKQAVIYANNQIFEQRAEQPQYSHMSCVLTAALIEIDERRINMAHVGDTRMYQFGENGIVKLSHDHSLVGYREEMGELSELEAMHHPQRNLISRDVGSMHIESDDQGYVEIAIFPLESPSMLLLCSDGLTDMITSTQIGDVLNGEVAVGDKAQMLVDAAKEAGGKDNVTVVLVDVRLESRTTEEDVVTLSDKVDAENITQVVVEQGERRGKTKARLLVWPILLALVVGYLLGGYTSPSWLSKSKSVKVASEVAVSADPMHVASDSLQLNPETPEGQNGDSVAANLPADTPA